MFIVPLHLPRWMPLPIARAVSAKFKAFSFPVVKSYSVIPYSTFYSVPLSQMQLCTKLYIITLDKLFVRFDTDRPHPDKHYIPLVCCSTHRSPKQHHILLPSTVVLTGLPDYNTILHLFRSTQRSP